MYLHNCVNALPPSILFQIQIISNLALLSFLWSTRLSLLCKLISTLACSQTSHSVLHYFCSVDLSKSLPIDCVNTYLFSMFFSIFFQSCLVEKVFLNWLCQYLSFLNIFFNRFCPVEKCGVTPHCLCRDSLTLTYSSKQFLMLCVNNIGPAKKLQADIIDF